MRRVTTAIVSDLHLGLANGNDLLRRPEAQRALAAAIDEADELVLLGDVVELRERPAAQALADARPALEEIGRAARGKRITIVPGNHDHELATPLLNALRVDGRPLDLQTFAEPPASGHPLAEVAAALGAGTRVAYPGVWVRDDVYATHGHYLDLHNTVPSLERLGIGLVQRVTGRVARDGPLTPADYERAAAPVYAAVYALAQSVRGSSAAGGGAASQAMWQIANGRRGRLPKLLLGGVALPAAVAGLNLAGFGPLSADLSGAELRRAGLAGMHEAMERLGIEAPHVVFGHTHRSGPHAGDEGWGGLVNSGSWVYEPGFVGGDGNRSPYWPGHCVFVHDDVSPPELRALL